MMTHKAFLVVCAVVLLAAAGAAEEEKHDLRERYEKDSVETADSMVELQVDMKVSVGNREGKLPMKFKQVQEYVQKTLKTDRDDRPEKVARHFEKSTMDIQHPASKPQSGSTAYEGKTYIIERTTDGTKAESLDGKEVTREAAAELGVAVAGSRHKLLPGKTVEVGASWDVPLDAVRELFNIPGKAEGKATARFAEVKEHEGEKSAVVRVEMEMKVPQAELVFHYKGQGRVDFSLKHKRITSYTLSAKIQVSGTQKSEYGETKFSGEGTAKSTFKTTPGKGEIDLSPTKKSEPEGGDEQKEPSGEDAGG